ncbi:MAG: hypothetical protein AB7F86_04570 [Bdellovibrionales bacterium]
MKALLIFAFTLAGCASTPKLTSDSIQPMDSDSYIKLIQRNTAHTDQYSGFYQTFQADVTILTTEVQAASLRQKGHFLQWDQRQFQSEREKSLQESNAYSKFFLRFFSPDKDYDDLHKGKTIWKVFLDYSGRRFEGKVAKMSEKMSEVVQLYPHMDRFSTPYEITFNVPMTTIEQGEVKIILTSSLGQAEFSFPVGK